MNFTRTMDTKPQETEGFGEENSGKKKSKFKTFKKFFGKRKRKETLSSGSSSLKPCQSTSDVTAAQSIHIDYDSEDELGMHKSVMGSRALSHDSIFIPEAAQEPARPGRVFSQENVSDRIRALQLKLQQNWKLGISSPFGTPSKKVDDAGMSSEDDGLPKSPPESSLLQEILNSSSAKFSDSHKHLSSLSLAGTGSEEEEQVSSSPLRPCSAESQLFPRQSSAKVIALQRSDDSLLPPPDFDTPPEFSSCLDNSAAKHKLLIKPRNQRSSKTRRQRSRTLSESQNGLSSTHEEDESEKREILAELTSEGGSSSHQELTEITASSNNAVYSQPPKMAKDFQHNLGQQNEKACTLHTASELNSPPCENNPQDCQTMQELLHTALSSSSSSITTKSGPKEGIATLSLIPDQEPQSEKEHSETLKRSTKNLSGMSLHILNQECKHTGDVPSKNDILPGKTVLAKKDVHSALEETEKNTPKDAKTLIEDTYNKGSPSLPNSINLLLKSPVQHTNIAYAEKSNSSQTSCTSPSPQTGAFSSLTLDKTKATQEPLVSDKGSNLPAVPDKLTLERKSEKEASEPSALRKFSVSSAQGRPRTSSMKDNSACDSPLSMQISQTKIKNSSRNEKLKENVPLNSSQEKKINTSKQVSPPESEIVDTALDRTVVGSLLQATSSKPALSNSGTSLPSNADQSNCEDRSPFQVKLRSTSLSVKYRDSSLQESKEIKRYSAEFNLEKAGLPSSLLKVEKAETRKTADTTVVGFLNESFKTKTKSSEQCSTKPPLPRKPILQHFIISGTNISLEKQEKGIGCPELKHEDRDLEKKSSLSEVPEKNMASPVVAVDAARGTETQTMPAWITIAKQKQRDAEQGFSGEEKPVAQDKAEAEKPFKEREAVEEAVKQQTDFTWNTFSPTVPSEGQKKETTFDTQESLPRGALLSHSPGQSSMPTEKEDIKPLKKASQSSLDQPSWMELAKKKSQAWSDMPQMIK